MIIQYNTDSVTINHISTNQRPPKSLLSIVKMSALKNWSEELRCHTEIFPTS